MQANGLGGNNGDDRLSHDETAFVLKRELYAEVEPSPYADMDCGANRSDLLTVNDPFNYGDDGIRGADAVAGWFSAPQA
ncbi:MAG: hypothetical protein JNN16_00840 [Nitrospira sp.]|nr:hypothetical protein [Nitrospira sp.]